MKSNNEFLFKKIHDKILDNYNKNNSKESLFRINEKMFINK